MCNKTDSKTAKTPDPKVLGKGMANKAAKTLSGRQKRVELALKEAGP
jgi:hypothetical protein